MYPIPSSEHLIENRTCKKCGNSFPITDKDIEFYEKVSPTFGGKIYPIPPPTFCPDCRQQRRLTFRNERKLYKRKCDATGREILSMFSPSSSFTVYNPDDWHKYDFLNQGYNTPTFQDSFFSQFYTQIKSTPLLGLSVAYNENCEYTNQCGNSKDCYYSFDIGMVEHALYCNFVDDSSYLLDCSSTHESHHCYSCIDTFYCTNSSYLLRCSDCSFSTRLVDCRGCQSCSECINLSNARYCHRNKQYTQEEWEALQRNPGSDETQWEDSLLHVPRMNLTLLSSPQSIGDHISFSKNTFYSFETKDAENVKYIDRSRILNDCMDIRGFGNNLQMSYDSLSVGLNGYHVLFSMHCWSNVSDLYYCMYCTDGTKNCFGCIGLKGQQYCILNRQYTKEVYETLVPKIIEKMMADGEWGEFFPASLSPFGYNETVANEYFPLEKEEAIKQGFNWSDYEAPFPKVEKIIPASKLPDTIESIPDEILTWAIECEVSGKLFRIISQELEFYRKHNLPVPRRHPDVRHLDRMKMRNPRKLFERFCDCPNCEENWRMKGLIVDGNNSALRDNEKSSGGRRKKMITTYSPERTERVYCEVCYGKEVLS